MKEITKTYVVYNYDELSEKAQEKVKEKAREELVEIRCDNLPWDLLDYLENTWNLILAKEELFYSLSYSQGDGACFEMDSLFDERRLRNYFNGGTSIKDLNPFEELVAKELSFEDQKSLMEYLGAGYVVSVVKTYWQYEHSKTCSFQWGWYRNNDLAVEEKINEVVDRLFSNNALFRERYEEICNAIETIGYEIIDPSEDEIENYIEESECVFLEDGSIFSE